MSEKEYLLDRTEVTEPLSFDTETIAGKTLMLEATKAMYCVYDNDFRSLSDTHKLQVAEDLTESVDLFCDPFYIVRYYQGHPNSGHDLCTAIDMEKFCALAQRIQMRGGHAHIFCFALQFSFSLRRLCSLAKVLQKLRRNRGVRGEENAVVLKSSAG